MTSPRCSRSSSRGARSLAQAAAGRPSARPRLSRSPRCQEWSWAAARPSATSRATPSRPPTSPRSPWCLPGRAPGATGPAQSTARWSGPLPCRDASVSPASPAVQRRGASLASLCGRRRTRRWPPALVDHRRPGRPRRRRGPSCPAQGAAPSAAGRASPPTCRELAALGLRAVHVDACDDCWLVAPPLFRGNDRGDRQSTGICAAAKAASAPNRRCLVSGACDLQGCAGSEARRHVLFAARHSE